MMWVTETGTGTHIWGDASPDSPSAPLQEFYPKKEPGFQPPAKDQAPSQLLGKGQAGQDGDGEGEPAVPELPGAPWRDGRAGGGSAVPAPHACTPPPRASHPLFFLQPGTAGGCGGPWVGTQPHAADFPPEPGPGQPSEPKDERLAYQSLQPGSPPGRGEPDPSPPLTDRHYPPALAKPEPPPACLCTTPGCDGCPGVSCGVLGPFEPTLGIPGGRFPCPPSNHTKLKKTWLTRHSEQSLPCCKAPRRDGGLEPAGEGKRSAKRPHGTADGARAAGEGAGAAKRGTKASEHVVVACPGDGVESGGDAEERRMELGEGDPSSLAGPEPREPWCLQSVPCTALPESIPRCCACAARAVGDPQGEEEEEEDPPESTCRLLHFRRTSPPVTPLWSIFSCHPASEHPLPSPLSCRFAFGDGGELSVDGFCTLGEAEGETRRLEAAGPERGSRSTGSSLCLAKYLLGVLGDPFCEAVRRDGDTWPGAPSGSEGKWGPGRGATLGTPGRLRAVFPAGVTAWRRGEGAPRLCDACQRSFFNSHWSCARCGFQLCPNCHRSRREADGRGMGIWGACKGGVSPAGAWRGRTHPLSDAEGPARPPECIPGQDHHVASLVPTQFVPTRVLTRLWKLLHEVRAKFGIESRCPCKEGAAEQSPAEPPGSRQELPGSAVPPLPPSSDGQADTSRAIKEGRAGCSPPAAGRAPLRGGQGCCTASPTGCWVGGERRRRARAALTPFPPPPRAESPEGGPPSPGQPPPRGAVQTTTLCDLLASTAVKLCLGQDGVRMAFAPVSPALPSDNHLTSILDSIIARVVERKIQERQAGAELTPPSPPGPPGPSGPPASHCILAPSGLLWLHDPGHASNYKLFQEHWRQGQVSPPLPRDAWRHRGPPPRPPPAPPALAEPRLPRQPVLVSGLQKRLEGRLWGPESLCPARGEQAVEVVNLRAPASRLRMSSQEFWDGFAASATSPEPEQGGGDLLKLESGFGDTDLCRAANLSASLPLPEYCGPTGRLNLATYLRGQRGRRWLRPRICVAYGVRPRDRTIGTKNLTVEAADSISVLVHAAARLPEQPAARQGRASTWGGGPPTPAPHPGPPLSTPLSPDLLLQADADGVDAPLKERLRDAGSRPGALWHIFRAEDAGRIQDFLQKACEDQGQEGAAVAEPPSRYLDLSLRRRLHEECGVSGWTLLQFLGDAVLVPAGAPHQVQTLTGTISVEQRFLSPENAARLRDHSTHPPRAARQLHAQVGGWWFGGCGGGPKCGVRGADPLFAPLQLDGMIFSAVREAVGVLRGCK
ncbi:hypothetical protein QYF61_006809 [Mycteria americana]|uniref:Lysine-specific demethylase n=1 Tax=Mycteria americana TaxID=33587 RepID=A0AAN7MLH5_MYCAM|nr:hypothetical protein QYF61_006809 [Mycteria americana]